MRRILLPLLLLLPPMSADASDTPKPVLHVFQGLSARDNWERNPHEHYRYTLHRQCYCPTPKDVRVEVVAGQVTRVTDLASGKDVAPRLLSAYAGIDELLARIDAAVQRRPDSLRIEYDRHLGYPKRVYIDPSYRVADDETDYRIEDVTIL